MNGDRQRLRQALRRRRAALTAGERRAATTTLTRRFLRHPRFRKARRVALYSACGSEIDLWPLVHAALGAGKRVFLPIVRGSRLFFVPYRANSRLIRRAFGIAEPLASGPRVWRRELDLVIAPLVGFDTRGNRLGQGGGYYDRAFCAHRHASWRRPTLAGAAFELQRCARIDSAPWDVALEFVLTERS